MKITDAALALEAGAMHGEGPAWDEARQALLWVDMTGQKLHMTARGPTDHVTDFDRPVCAVAPRQHGGVALALADGFWLQGPNGDLRRAAAIPSPDASDCIVNMNDGKCDPAGRFWAGSMAANGCVGAGSLFRLDPDGSIRTMLREVTVSNGLAWSRDGATMFYIDTWTQRVDAFDVEPEFGEIGRRRPFLHIDPTIGQPDGMTIDDDGCLWIAMWRGGTVCRYTPAGKLDTIVRLPCTQVTSCCFGGPDLDELYITSSRLGLEDSVLSDQPLAGSVFVVKPGTTGPAAVPYGG